MNATLTQALLAAIALTSLAAAPGCKRDAADAGHKHDETASPTAGATQPVPSNRIDVPEKVRQNLGITFAKVEQRRVAATIRVPGRFELLPSARREYRAVLPGHVELLVRQYETVKEGQVLARLDSPEWRRVQHEAVEAEGEIKTAQAHLDVAEATRAENEKAVALLAKRVAALAEANTRRAELDVELALAQGKAARLDAEVRSAKVRQSEAREHYASKLKTLASVVGIPVERLTEPAPESGPAAPHPAPGKEPAEREPLWRTIAAVELRASQAGVVEAVAITNGGWADSSGLVLTTVDPSRIRFRATGLQADLSKLREGAVAAVVAPAAARSNPGAATALLPIPGKLSFGLEASADNRTIDLLIAPDQGKPAAWARPGVSAYAEIVTDDSVDAEPAIPVAAVVQDELARIYFRRDPKDANKVIRVEGDFGVSDGRWVVVNSGLKAGDEVVLDGVYELKLTGTGTGGGGAGGHFHADGTWHAAGTPEPGGKK